MKATTILQTDGALASQNAIKEMEHGTTMDYENDNIDGAARLSNAFLIRNIGIVVAGLALGIALSAGVLTSGTASVPGNDLVTNLNDDFSMVYGIHDDEWVFGPPFNELNPGSQPTTVSARIKVGQGFHTIPDDEWIFGSPYIELNPVSHNLSAEGNPI